MFDEKTRKAIKQNTNNFGDGLAGRGLGLNNTIHELRPLVTNAVPVLHNLADPQHRSARPVHRARPRRLRSPRPWPRRRPTTTATWTRSSPPSRASRARSKQRPRAARPRSNRPPTRFPSRRRFVRKGDRVHAPAAPERQRAAHCRATARPRLRRRRGQPARRHRAQRAPGRIRRSAGRIRAATRSSTLGFEDFTQTLELGNPLLAGLAPAQTQCNYLTLAFRNVANLETENVGVGTLARAGIVLSPTGPTTRASPSSAPANGPSERNTLATTAPGRPEQQPRARQPLPERRAARASGRSAKPATRPTSQARP